MDVISPSEQLLFSTIRIETTNSIGVQGIGTGFILSYKHSSGEILFIATNKHVVEGAVEGKITLSQGKDGKPNIGVSYSIVIKDFGKIWFGNPDETIDVTVTPLVPLLQHARQNNISPYFVSIPDSFIPSEEVVESLDALEDIVFIGYPNGIWDDVNFLPIMRRGITATPLNIDFQGRKQFLIDASVFPGSSGSPVFILNTGVYFDKRTNGTTAGVRVFFLGIVASVFFKQDQNEIRMITVPTVEVPVAISRQVINLGVVFKASTIIETIKKCLISLGMSAE